MPELRVMFSVAEVPAKYTASLKFTVTAITLPALYEPSAVVEVMLVTTGRVMSTVMFSGVVVARLTLPAASVCMALMA